MWSNPQNQPPIEKVRKAQWSVENTRKTQAEVDGLWASMNALIHVVGYKAPVLDHIRAAIERFCTLDPKVKRPW